MLASASHYIDFDKVLPTLGCGVHRMPTNTFIFSEHGYSCLPPIVLDLFSQIGVGQDEYKDYTVDVKIHMLMPDQFPCIPNWHFDLVPRDQEGKQDFSKVRYCEPIFLFVSGAPLTEIRFQSTGEVVEIDPKRWNMIDQLTEHRGQASKEHCWRLFMRVAHKRIFPPNPPEKWDRRHCQVYLDSNNFKW